MGDEERAAADQMRREVKGLCLDCGAVLGVVALKHLAAGVVDDYRWDLCGECFSFLRPVTNFF